MNPKQWDNIVKNLNEEIVRDGKGLIKKELETMSNSLQRYCFSISQTFHEEMLISIKKIEIILNTTEKGKNDSVM